MQGDPFSVTSFQLPVVSSGFQLPGSSWHIQLTNAFAESGRRRARGGVTYLPTLNATSFWAVPCSVLADTSIR